MHAICKYIILSFTALLAYSGTAFAQFTIKPRHEEVKIEPLQLVAERPVTQLENDFFDHAAWEAERRRVRRERNTVEFNPVLETSMQQYENWTSSGGGQNNFAALASVFFKHQYKREKFNIVYQTEAKYGMNYLDNTFFKTQDMFRIKMQMGWAINNDWSYSASSLLESQFTTTYVSRTDKTVKSKFMAPGTIDIGVGFTYSRKGSPFVFTFSAVNGKITTIFDQELADLGKYGAKGDRIKGAMGPQAMIDFNKTFGKRKNYTYRTDFSAFFPYRDFGNPTLQWNHNLSIQLSRYFTARFTGKLLYDFDKTAAAASQNRKIQYQYTFTLGISYKYKNK